MDRLDRESPSKGAMGLFCFERLADFDVHRLCHVGVELCEPLNTLLSLYVFRARTRARNRRC